MLKIQNAVSETLLIPLYMKYLDAQEPAPILNDPAAARLVPQIDYDFAKFRLARRSQIGTALRARYFDQLTADFIRRKPEAVVVAVGCGLDSRYERLGQAAAHTPFYQLDLPDVIALRRELLPPLPNETLLAASAFSTDWMNDLRQRHPHSPCFFVLEGVLMYFPEPDVRSLFQNLAQRFPGGELAFDVAGSFMVNHSDQHDALKHARAQFDFACDDDRQMEAWADNLHLVSAKHMTDFPAARRIGFSYWLMRTIAKIRNSYRLLHYHIS
ncbi:class I SAM-dependent methyltransferase [Eikenella sp. S3360]|uniref:Class I SAM-dependent methyltransferase n=1 Tax=Eikenella glucosivorans TaxID=2766967 RepID=A0ABS0NC63_9NEIS|nr:class I SAM-dependent methyltransferase [Eikenella glucosivorans]MBH5329918.1 class I SAM-dependent methyltransferase [Eikenella glucosivorans]